METFNFGEMLQISSILGHTTIFDAKTIYLKSYDPDLSTRIGQKYPNHLQEILEFSKLLILGELKNMSITLSGGEVYDVRFKF